MKNCTDCKFAKWRETASGKKHPSGDGACTYPVTLPELPKSMYYAGMREPVIHGGYINRREDLKDHCCYFQWRS